MTEPANDPSPWEGTTPVATLSPNSGSVTLVEAQTFCLSGRSGDLSPEFPHGLFFLDTRMLSCWQLLLNGHQLQPLTVAVDEPFSATFVGRGHPPLGQADADLTCFRHRDIGQGMRERVVVTNHGLGTSEIDLELRCDVDFADVFEVKEGRVTRRGQHSAEIEGETLRYTHQDGDLVRSVILHLAHPTAAEPGRVRWRRTLGPRETLDVCLELRIVLDGRDVSPRFTCDDTGVSIPQERQVQWRARVPQVSSDDANLVEAVEQATIDLGALRIFDPEHPDVPILAAGAPWFMTVFGRDSLLTAWMTLIADPSLAEGVLQTLARFQGSDLDEQTEEEPGKILHEMRFGGAGGLALGGGDIYYGTIDATPLFVMLLDELRRWDVEDDFVRQMLPHADRAMDWIAQYGDRDGDGYIEYERRSARGLVNQGWKDSWDAIRHANGELAKGPIALCEVQGYVYAAYRARAELARTFDDEDRCEHYLQLADDLRRRFNEDFWVESRGWYALALDGDKRPVDALTSNIGHCLWTGIIDPERASLVADHLVADDLFSGWGIRTMATSMAAYNPVSYHNGSVWPHDNALCIAGLARYGFMEHAHRAIRGQLAASATHRGRLPELFAGFDRSQLSTPASYPTSCSPQAWAAASPLLWIRSLLGIEPLAPDGALWMDPHLPPWISQLRVEGINIADRDITIHVDQGEMTIEGAGDLDVNLEQRRPGQDNRPFAARPE